MPNHRAEKLKIKNFVSMFFIFLMVSGLWAVDVGAGCMCGACTLTTGWDTVSPTQHYHIGLLLVMISGLVLGINGMVFE